MPDYILEINVRQGSVTQENPYEILTLRLKTAGGEKAFKSHVYAHGVEKRTIMSEALRIVSNSYRSRKGNTLSICTLHDEGFAFELVPYLEKETGLDILVDHPDLLRFETDVVNNFSFSKLRETLADLTSSDQSFSSHL